MCGHTVGWLGLILMLVSYYLLSKGKLDGRSNTYQYLNLVGAAALGVNAYTQEAWPILVLEIFWCYIAITTLSSIAKNEE